MSAANPRNREQLLASARRMAARYAANGWEYSPRAIAGSLRVGTEVASDLYNATYQEFERLEKLAKKAKEAARA